MPNMIGLPPPRLPSSWTKRFAAFAAVVLVGVLGISLWIRGPVTPPGPVSGAATPIASHAAVHWSAHEGSDEEAPRPARNAAEVRGKVVDAATGEPIGGADVTLRDERGEIADEEASNPDGTFVFEKSDAKTIAVQATGYAFVAESIPAGDGATRIVLALDGAAAISGKVVDERGAAVPGAEVWIEDVEGSRQRWPTPVSSTATSRADGTFRIADAPAGRLVAQARDGGHVKATAEIGVVGPGKSRDGVVLTLRGGGILSGRVTLDGAPVAGAQVAWMGKSDDSGARSEVAETRAVTAEDGTFHLDHLPAGDGYAAAATGEASGVANASVVEDEESHVEIAIARGGELAGHVVDGDGAPIEGARVRVYSRGFTEESDFAIAAVRADLRRREPTTTAADGSFRLRGLHGDGPFLVVASADDDEAQTSAWRGATDVVITLHAGAIVRGRVLAPDGTRVSEKGEVTAVPVLAKKDASARMFETTSAGAIDGAYEIRGLAPGEWTLSAEVPGWGESEPKKIKVTGRETITLDFRLGKRVTIRGSLVDERGKPVRGARVSIARRGRTDIFGASQGGELDWGSATRSNAAGAFTVGASPGEQRLYVYHPDFQPFLLPVTLGDEGADLGTITLHSGEGTSAVFEFSGIGAVISRAEDGRYVVQSLIPGGPAERAGVKPKDVVMGVDGVIATDLTMEDLISRIRGPVGTTVTLELARAGNVDPVRIDIVREKIQA